MEVLRFLRMFNFIGMYLIEAIVSKNTLTPTRFPLRIRTDTSGGAIV